MRLYIYIVFILFTLVNTAFGQNTNRLKEYSCNVIRYRQVKDYLLKKSSSPSIHKDFVYQAKQTLFNNLNINYFNSDTLIFVEFCGIESEGYMCSIYLSEGYVLQSFFIDGKLSIKYLDKNKAIGGYVIPKIREGKLEEVLLEGKKTEIYPEDYIYITIAMLNKGKYDIESYSTKFFIPPK